MRMFENRKKEFDKNLMACRSTIKTISDVTLYCHAG